MGSSRRHGKELGGLSVKIKVASGLSGSQHRSPARSKSDGVFQPQRREPAHLVARGGLFAGRYRDVGLGWQRVTYRDGGESEVEGDWATSDRSQHRAGTQVGGCIVRLENHRTLPVLWTAFAGSALILQRVGSYSHYLSHLEIRI